MVTKMMTKKNRAILTALLVGAFGLSACDSVEPPEGDGGEQELITYVSLTVTQQGSDKTAVYEAEFDEAGVLLAIDTIHVVAGRDYDALIDLQNATVDPPESLLPEIREQEPESHRFFYEPEGGVAGRMTVDSLNEDPNGDELGTTFVLIVAGGAATGDLRVVLRHYGEDADLPTDKQLDSPGNPEVPGVVENDLDLVFPIQITD